MPEGCEVAVCPLGAKAVERWDGTTACLLGQYHIDRYDESKPLSAVGVGLGRSSTRHALVPRATGGVLWGS